VNAFHVLGGLLALWALVVSFLGVTREGFPEGRAQERLVTALSIILVAGAIGSAIYTGATEEEEEPEEGEQAALVLR
jgi:formate-dependent nitrite reductase membrane component NrfD